MLFRSMCGERQTETHKEGREWGNRRQARQADSDTFKNNWKKRPESGYALDTLMINMNNTSKLQK